MKKILSFLLTALLIFQSVVVFADNHQLHQTGQQHLSFDHQHTKASDKKISDTATSQFDCHHCCHCHHFSHAAVFSQNKSFNLPLLSIHHNDYSTRYLFPPFSPELRPPII